MCRRSQFYNATIATLVHLLTWQYLSELSRKFVHFLSLTSFPSLFADSWLTKLSPNDIWVDSMTLSPENGSLCLCYKNITRSNTFWPPIHIDFQMLYALYIKIYKSSHFYPLCCLIIYIWHGNRRCYDVTSLRMS